MWRWLPPNKVLVLLDVSSSFRLWIWIWICRLGSNLSSSSVRRSAQIQAYFSFSLLSLALALFYSSSLICRWPCQRDRRSQCESKLPVCTRTIATTTTTASWASRKAAANLVVIALFVLRFSSPFGVLFQPFIGSSHVLLLKPVLPILTGQCVSLRERCLLGMALTEENQVCSEKWS